MDFFDNIPIKTRWNTMYMFRSQDLNKAIIREHYMAPTLEEISHKLAGVTVFPN